MVSLRRPPRPAGMRGAACPDGTLAVGRVKRGGCRPEGRSLPALSNARGRRGEAIGWRKARRPRAAVRHRPIGPSAPLGKPPCGGSYRQTGWRGGRKRGRVVVRSSLLLLGKGGGVAGLLGGGAAALQLLLGGLELLLVAGVEAAEHLGGDFLLLGVAEVDDDGLSVLPETSMTSVAFCSSATASMTLTISLTSSSSRSRRIFWSC